MRSLHLSILFFAIALVIPAAYGQQVTLKVGDATGAPGKEVEVPILILGSQKAGPMQFIVDYDRRLLQPIVDAPDAEPRGAVFSSGITGMISRNVAEPGEVKIALRTDEPIKEDRELIRLRFLVKGQNGDTCALNILVPEVWEQESLFELPARGGSGRFEVRGGLFSFSLPLGKR